MEYICEKTEFQLKNSAVTLGKFDGMHLGHQLLLNQILDLKKDGFTSSVFTFSFHPYNLFAEKEIDLIYTKEEKRRQLEKMGIDAMVVYPFTKEVASMEPEDFVKEILVKKFDAKIIVVGHDFCFGKNRRGNVTFLKELEHFYGFEVMAFPKVRRGNKTISSSLVREEIRMGNMEEVSYLLGRSYSITGIVVHGKKIGRTIGIPTINIIPERGKLLPPYGVYVSTVLIDGQFYRGVSNVGCKPTVQGEPLIGVETHLLDFNRDLYGKEIKVCLHHYKRAEQKFSSVEELKKQMEEDIRLATKYFI